MRNVAAVFSVLLLLGMAVPAVAQESIKPEAVVERMAFKLARGVTNVTTAIVEIPKQSYLTVRDRGSIGYVIGPLKGLGMGIYRLLVGGAETVFFMVPQPGYYDPMVDPPYVWNGWEDRRPEQLKSPGTVQEAPPVKQEE
ncbi:exosortase system-associated protein, TIGR04073 family [Geobacter sp. DSM 9736]|uniref:exosortase system-associated protein, TIGR04073 family n=1 Tax=Geobacter sp. DSM 9736 TaxID=1277350 RepID=UPI000B50C95F|nr:exosortase system-associated protein, TIGR04073 family [Geobacter sp. DSM 9736]SNB47843.1 putative exosortase-associated protein, TIGR04073 family [Geobacter sp. DSM 9736]